MKKNLFACLAALSLLGGCTDHDVTNPDPNRIYQGAAQSLGDGEVYAWAKFTDDTPTAIGMTFTRAALDNIPHGAPIDLVLPLPKEAIGRTLFDHVYLGFSHMGHEPVGIYDVPHFDIHFMMQSVADRAAIPPYIPQTAAKFDNLPADGFIPKPYFRLPGGVPKMGVHWANPTSPELNGGKFTETLVMGSYDGAHTFIEPMATLAYLQSKPDVTHSLIVPTKFAKAGYYPTKYSIRQVGDEVLVSIDNLTMVQ